jgi:V/A-type H+-transporting ATPase subunit D
MLGETENSIQILSSEIKASRKVVNSLENFVLPDLMRSRKWVKLRLEQMDREDLLRYKMIKRKFGK